MGDSSEADDPLTGVQDQGYDWASNTLGVDLYTDQGLTTDYAYATTTTAVQSTGTSGRGGGRHRGVRPVRLPRERERRIPCAAGRLYLRLAHGRRADLYPPGTSKWNPIEHRLFSQITATWAGFVLSTLWRYCWDSSAAPRRERG